VTKMKSVEISEWTETTCGYCSTGRSKPSRNNMTINNLVQIGIKGGEAEVELNTAVDVIVPAA
jgi:hypothetical protein